MNEKQLRLEVALFYNAMEMMGWDDLIFTPVTVQIPGTEHFLIHEYGLMFDEVTPENLVKIDINGNIIDGKGPIALSSWYMHKAIHEARPNEHWVVHWHSPDVCALSNDPRGVLPISQHAQVVRAGGYVYHKYDGPVVMGQAYEDLKREVSGNVRFILLESHGASILANNVDEAFWNMYCLQLAAETQNKSVQSPILISQKVEDEFNEKYEMFRASIPKNGLWDAIKRKLRKNSAKNNR